MPQTQEHTSTVSWTVRITQRIVPEIMTCKQIGETQLAANSPLLITSSDCCCGGGTLIGSELSAVDESPENGK